MDRYINKIVGQYQILKKCIGKSSDGHALYDAKCIRCGHVRHNVRIDSCTDYNWNCVHTTNTTKWYSYKLRTKFYKMKVRCYDKNNKDYRFYGFKGVKICDEWLNDPQLFNDWAVDTGYNDKLSIDRMDANDNYCPDNCRWVTINNNSKYKSTSNLIVVDGILNTGRGWAAKLGVSTNYINGFIRKNGYDECVKYIRYRLNMGV